MTNENTLEAVQVLINQEHAASSDIFIIKWILPLSFSANYRFEFTFSFLSFQRNYTLPVPFGATRIKISPTSISLLEFGINNKEKVSGYIARE